MLLILSEAPLLLNDGPLFIPIRTLQVSDPNGGVMHAIDLFIFVLIGFILRKRNEYFSFEIVGNILSRELESLKDIKP